jgi:hypothetical protein
LITKFPEKSALRNYDLFEELPDGSTVWKGFVSGMENVELRLQELGRASTHKFVAVKLDDHEPAIRPLRSPAKQDIRHAS